MQDFIVNPNNIDRASANCTERSLRQRTLKSALVTYGNGAITVECLVRDMSAGGAKLKMVNDTPIPNTFQLHIPLDGVSVNCEVRWREKNQLGIAFVSEVVITEQAKRQVVTPTFNRGE